MKDTIIKGTGDSRLLKSALPAGTSWVEALAMLRTGTFPIDLAGINPSGIQQMGDALSKANLFKDHTASTLGLPTTAVVDDGIAAAYLKAIGRCQVSITALLPNGNPAAGATITGLTGADSVVTDANGKLDAFVTATNITVQISGYLDVVGTPKTINTPIGQRVYLTLVSTKKASPSATITASASNLLLSEAVLDLDVFCVGGGAGGSSSYGGGGGYTTTQKNIPRKSTPENAIVGAGGAKNANGGNTSFYGVSAQGGQGIHGGSGGGARYGHHQYYLTGGNGGSNGTGGDPSGAGIYYAPGGNGQGTTTRAFGEAGGALYAGGGGGPCATNGGTTVGGAGGGGSGGSTVTTAGAASTGGGGGGGLNDTDNKPGGSGVILVRWRYKP